MLGFILGIIGLIIEIFLPNHRQQARSASYARMDSARRLPRTNEGSRMLADLKKDQEDRGGS
jgi:hypothetical protein